MDLRQRDKLNFVGFTQVEVRKMERLLTKYKDESLKDDFCKNVARALNRSTGRAGKPVAKWPEIQNWFSDNLEKVPNEISLQIKKKSPHRDRIVFVAEQQRDGELSVLEFEARSSKDGAWYDVDTFLSHRLVDSGQSEFLVRYVGFGAEGDEWVNSRNSLRKRSVALGLSDCHKVKIGDGVVCFRESDDHQAKYYDARVVGIETRWHDMRGCRCLFLIRYDHDGVEEKVRLRRLCV
ncbi:hypothetical protein M569_08118, partial [Genlisea aurea]